MSTLPVLPDLALFTLPGEGVTPAAPVLSMPPVPGQLPDQAFGSILTEMLGKDPYEEENTDNPAFVFPIETPPIVRPVPNGSAEFTTLPADQPSAGQLQSALPFQDANASVDMSHTGEVSMIAMPAIIDATGDISELLPDVTATRLDALPTNTMPIGDRAALKAITFTSAPAHSSANPPADPLGERLSTSLLRAGAPPSAADSAAGTPHVTMNMNSMPAFPLTGRDQTTDPAIFAGSGKSLPLTALSAITPPGNVPPPAGANTSAVITTAVSHPAWPDELGQKITWMTTQRLQSAELKLHPAHLGPIEITLQLSGEQQISAQFVSHHPAVRETIEANLPKLREIMAENGITLADTSVSADNSRQQSEGRQDRSLSRPGTHGSAYNSASQHATHSSPIRHTGLIDTFA